MSYYAVRYGKIPGIYTCWNTCKEQVLGFKGAVYKKFSDKIQAESFCKDTTKRISKKRTYKNKQLKKKHIKKDDNALYIFTDGSSINNGTKKSKAGYGIYIPEPNEFSVKLSKKLPKGKTNNYAELKAILEALKLTDYSNNQTENNKIIIVTDSMYSINCITQWYHSWIKKGWISSSGEKVKNKELIQEIKPLCDKYNVHFQHINSHTGNSGYFYEGNRIADKLASGENI
tara:strand:+ start:57 stop:746 length:690 start_codon:yes stop_codon:yes gene_type:complete